MMMTISPLWFPFCHYESVISYLLIYILCVEDSSTHTHTHTQARTIHTYTSTYNTHIHTPVWNSKQYAQITVCSYWLLFLPYKEEIWNNADLYFWVISNRTRQTIVHSSGDQFNWFVELFCVSKIKKKKIIKLLILLSVRCLHSQVQPLKFFEFSSLFP